MRITTKGDLIYVPSDVTLYINDGAGTVQKITKLSKPANLLVTEVTAKSYENLYEGEKWLVNKNLAYEVKNE